MGDVKGRDLTLAYSTNGSNYTDVAGVKDVSMSGSADTIDVTDNDSAGWKEHLDGEKSLTMSVTANWDEADSGLMGIFDGWENSTSIYLRYRPQGDGTGKQVVGIGTVTSFEESAAHDGAAEVSFEWMMTGSPTITDQ
jgi:TP901-1 family phage major tail protein